jgi:hypothetical protein
MELRIPCRKLSIEPQPDGTLLVVADALELPSNRDKNTRYDSTKVLDRLRELLGRKVSRKTLQNWITRRKGGLPHHKPAGRLVFIEGEVVGWANRIETKSLL